MSNVVRIQTENFDLNKEYNRLITKNSTAVQSYYFAGWCAILFHHNSWLVLIRAMGYKQRWAHGLH